MRSSVLSCVVLSTSFAAAFLESRQNLTGLVNVPQCALTCLSTSTAKQGTCSNLDIKCLCTNQQYVTSLSCCLASNCDAADQIKAITFNQQECGSVGETAPGFVGCSPSSLTSIVGLGTAASIISMMPSTPITTTTSSSINPLISTLTGSIDSDFGWETVKGIHPTTVAFAARPLLVSSCTVPNFAMVTDATNLTYLYPEVGCSNLRGDCCPYNAHEFAILPECPLDYFTTASACCPSGYEVYSTNLGFETPCVTMPSVTLVPGTTPTVSRLTVITNMVFARKYLLTDPNATPSTGLPAGAIAGIVVGAAVLFLTTTLLFFWLRRKAQVRKEAESQRFIPRSQEMAEPHDITRPSELASPQINPMKPHTTSSGRISNWKMGPSSPPSPPTYDGRPLPAKMTMPQELPGSTYIYEHHPAFEQDTSDRRTISAVSEPKSAPSAVSEPHVPRSPPASPPLASSPLVVSPMQSPAK